jgi:hypothetical protein
MAIAHRVECPIEKEGQGSAISGKSLYTPTQIGWNADKQGPFLAARTMNPSVYFPKTKLNGRFN